jgi:hypothetical protein
MEKPKDITQTVYRVYNITNGLMCSDFEELKKSCDYLKVIREIYPDCEFVVYRVSTNIYYDRMDW